MASSIRYNQSYPLNTLEAIDTPPFIAPKSKRTGLIVGIIVGVLVVIIIIIVVGVLVLRSRKTVKSPVTGDGSPIGITCIADSQCTAPKVCKTADKRCVDCTSNTQCAGSAFPFCKTENNTCVKCLTTNDCGDVNKTCSANLCCDSTPPVINSVTSTVGGDTRIDINLEIKQPTATTRIFVVLEDSAGIPLISKTCTDVKEGVTSIQCVTGVDCPAGDVCTAQKCQIKGCVSFAAGPFVSLVASAIGIPLVAFATYRVRVKAVYDCGLIKNASTPFSAPFRFTLGNCPTTPNPRSISSITNRGVIQGFLITFDVLNSTPTVPSPDFSVGIIVGTEPNFHPNRAIHFVPSVTTENFHTGFKVVTINYFGDITFGRIYYFRAFNLGNPGECAGPPGPVYAFYLPHRDPTVLNY